MNKIGMHWQILIAFILGIVYGILFPGGISYVSWMGDLFIRALKMMVVPLILTSIVSGITNIGSGKSLGKLGLKTFAYYISTSLLAILTGLFWVNIIQPGIGADLGLAKSVEGMSIGSSSFKDVLYNIIPTNLFEALSDQKMLSIIFFAILVGFFITKTDPKPKNFLIDLFNSGFEVVMKITLFIIKLAPFGIFGLVAVKAAEADMSVVGSIFWYVAAVVLALATHALFNLPMILKFSGKVSVMKHAKAVSTPLFTAFSTSSSSATLPLTMEAVEYNSGVSNKITSFTLPLGATVNMDGTALYECVAVVFIAQAYGVHLGIVEQIIVVLTALLASIGAAGIPMAGLFMMSIILTAVGLPLEGVGLILAVDRPLDMLRTSINVWSDTCGAVVVAKSEGEMLKV